MTTLNLKISGVSRPLTPKQEAFAQAYVEAGNASEAYRQCYNVRETTKPESVWQSACRLLADVKVASRVAQLQAALRGRHDDTVDSLCDEYDENRQAALETSQIGAANGATTGKARLLGLDKADAPTVNVTAKAAVLSDMELARRIASLLERGMTKLS